MCNLEVKGCYSIPVQCSSQVVQSNNFLYVCISVYYLRFQICCHTQNWHKTIKWLVAEWLRRIGPGKKVLSFLCLVFYQKWQRHSSLSLVSITTL